MQQLGMLVYIFYIIKYCFLSPLYRLLFAEPDRAKELFSLSGVDDSLRAQQLTLAQFEQLCTAYHSLSKQQQRHGHEHHFSSKFQVRTQKNT